MSRERALVLDAVALSALLDARRPDHPVARAVLAALVAKQAASADPDEEVFVVPVVALYEVRRGLVKVRADRRVRDLDTFIRSYAWVEDFDEATANTAAELWAERARDGRPAGERDLLILATAVEIDGDVITRDNGFPVTGDVAALTWSDLADELGVPST